MDSDTPKALIENFSILEDTRDGRRRRHLLIDILIIAITAVICGADGWTEIEEFGKSNERSHPAGRRCGVAQQTSGKIEGCAGNRDLNAHWCARTRMREWSARYRRGVVEGMASAATSHERLNPSPPCIPAHPIVQHEVIGHGAQVQEAATDNRSSPLRGD
jgi:hypothetical protein